MRAIRAAFETLIVIIAERHRQADRRQAIRGCCAGLAGAAVHDAALVRFGQYFMRQLAEHLRGVGSEDRTTVAKPHNRTFADACARQGARTFQTDAQHRPARPASTSPCSKWAMGADESDFLGARQQTDERRHCGA